MTRQIRVVENAAKGSWLTSELLGILRNIKEVHDDGVLINIEVDTGKVYLYFAEGDDLHCLFSTDIPSEFIFRYATAAERRVSIYEDSLPRL